MNRREWLAQVPWEMVVWQNAQLCKSKNAHHGPTSDGHADCKALWEESRMKAMSLEEMVDLCRRCHRLAPFTNYNGNTFAAIARSLAGHIVAGVASDEEVRAFRKFCESLG